MSVADFKLKIEKVLGKFTGKEDELDIPVELVDYKSEWKRFSEDCERITHLFNFDTENTYKYVEYLGHLEHIRHHLKKICELELKYKI